jgi:hypothetical protein
MSSMSINEARKILGEEESAKLSDEQLQDLIWKLESLASMTIKAIMNGDMKIPETEDD